MGRREARHMNKARAENGRYLMQVVTRSRPGFAAGEKQAAGFEALNFALPVSEFFIRWISSILF
jgi:hypothetical protein